MKVSFCHSYFQYFFFFKNLVATSLAKRQFSSVSCRRKGMPAALTFETYYKIFQAKPCLGRKIFQMSLLFPAKM